MECTKETIDWKRHLLISTVSCYPWVKRIFKDENGIVKLDGIGSSIIETMSKTMNFTYEFYNDPDLTYGTFFPENESWTGCGGLLQQKVVDMQFAWARELERQIRISPSKIFFTFNTMMLASVGDLEASNFIGFIRAFDVKIWYYMVILVSITIFISAMSDVLKREKGKRNKGFSKEVDFYFWLYISALFSEGSFKTPYSSRSQFLLGIWLLTILTLANGFSSQFKANLMSKNEEPKIRNAKDLSERPKLIPYLSKETTYLAAVQESEIPERQMVYQNALKYGAEALIDIQDLTNLQLYQEVKNGKGVIFADDLATKSFLMDTCSKLHGRRRFYFAEENLSPFFVIFGLRDDVPPCWLKKFNDRIQWMIEGHFFEKLAGEATWRYERCEEREQTTEMGLQLKNLLPVFYLLVGFQFCCTLIFWVEVLVRQLKQFV